jgi:hypothetical protein
MEQIREGGWGRSAAVLAAVMAVFCRHFVFLGVYLVENQSEGGKLRRSNVRDKGNLEDFLKPSFSAHSVRHNTHRRT